MKTNIKLLALAASSVALIAATPAAAQMTAPFDPVNAIGSSGAAAAPWSAVRIGGPTGTPCNTGAPVQLSNAYSNGTLGGRHGGMSPDQPILAKNLSTAQFNNGVIVAPGGILMHPGPTGECSVARLTIPAGQGGVYRIVARYAGGYANGGVSNGDGVNGMVLHNGAQIGNVVDTRQGAGQIIQQRTLCPGDTVDFAVHMKTGMSYDSTLLSGTVSRIGDAQCGTVVTVPNDTLQGPSPCCAPWSELDILPSLRPVFTNAGSPYTMSYSTPAGISAQMSAYLNYIHAMDPSITTLTLTWQAIDVGTTPGMTGTTVGAPQTVTWTWTSTGVNVTGGGFWGSQQFQIGRWYRFMTTLSHNGTANSPFFGRDCLINSRAVNWGVAARMATPSTTNARGQVMRGQAVEFVEGRPIETGQIRIRD